ncbi:hypothetical protein RMSM_00928 [Rhodopirellula maiorica SM1]|uniref:Uncharacterized protein n=1 Tax=Rhodopirellula maiorica SM1 TaxID=1265738 RepID=M5RSE3_9BACT|nr:hypothetical protein RMSM_00928 [Rhodopirellula maiorica SM1]
MQSGLLAVRGESNVICFRSGTRQSFFEPQQQIREFWRVPPLEQ